jgi:hypothetical protein
LQLLRSQGDEAEATTLARLTTSLELLDHETGNGTQGDLGRQRLVGGEKLLKLRWVLVTMTSQHDVGFTNLLLSQVIRKVGDHDLGLGRDAVSRGTTLPTLTRLTRLTSSARLGLAMLALPVGGSLVSDVLQSLNLGGRRRDAGNVLSRSGALFVILLVLSTC